MKYFSIFPKNIKFDKLQKNIVFTKSVKCRFYLNESIIKPFSSNNYEINELVNSDSFQENNNIVNSERNNELQTDKNSSQILIAEKTSELEETKDENLENYEDNDDNLINFGENFTNFAWNNNANYSPEMKARGENFFRKSNANMIHYLDDKNINDFKKGIIENNYDFYDVYKDIPEFLILGRSNVGKSTLINKIFFKEITKENKTPGKTQRLEFFIFGSEGKNKTQYKKKSIYSKIKIGHYNPCGIVIDAPGFGYVKAPVMLRKKFKYLIYTYLNYAVRLREIIYLINGHYGLTKMDEEELEFINQFGKEIQLVFTKCDRLGNNNIIKYLAHTAQFARGLKNVRTEILLTSARTGYGLQNLRSHLFLDIDEMKQRKNFANIREEIKYLEESETGLYAIENNNSLIEK